ncbi:HEPN domain-containing protein [Candidatus Bathyarchaeota archaeon]|nr:HEPN domain-containing protein [Candidatus Bathyarchaeota archaeon]
MKIVEIVTSGISRAARWLRGAERAFEDQRWDDVVYSAQMCVEQSAKSVLLLLGIDYPKEHDVSDVLSEAAGREDLPKWFKERIPFMSRYIAELAALRGLAGYGYEMSLGADYFKDYAGEALEAARTIHSLCERLVNQLS